MNPRFATHALATELEGPNHQERIRNALKDEVLKEEQ